MTVMHVFTKCVKLSEVSGKMIVPGLYRWYINSQGRPFKGLIIGKNSDFWVFLLTVLTC